MSPRLSGWFRIDAQIARIQLAPSDKPTRLGVYPSMMRYGAFAVVVALLLVGCGRSATQVVIPKRLQQTDLMDAFDIARSLGLRVTTTEEDAVSSLRMPSVMSVSPAPGSRIRSGDTVKFIVRAGPIGSPAVLKWDPHYRVPNFIGKPALSAVNWAGQHSMSWEIVSLPPLHASTADHLFDAYVVTAQTPKPGGVLNQGRLVGRAYHVSALSLTVATR